MKRLLVCKFMQTIVSESEQMVRIRNTDSMHTVPVLRL
jgi:hypothetical protein